MLRRVCGVSGVSAENPSVGQINLLLDALLRGELDCVIGSLPPEELKQDRIDMLRMEPVGDESVAVVAARNCPWARRRRITWEELQGERWVLPPLDSLLRRAFIRAFLDLGLTPPQPIVEVMSPLTIRSMIEFGGVHLGLVRSGHAAEDERLGVLRTLPVLSQLRLPPLAVFARRDATARQPIIEAVTDALRRVTREA